MTIAFAEKMPSSLIAAHLESTYGLKVTTLQLIRLELTWDMAYAHNACYYWLKSFQNKYVCEIVLTWCSHHPYKIIVIILLLVLFVYIADIEQRKENNKNNKESL